MRAASAYELLRSELQQAQQDAADLHIENVRLKAQLAALQWTPITPENLPKVGDEVYGCSDSSAIDAMVRPVSRNIYREMLEPKDWNEIGYTHFRPINAPPEPSGVQGKEIAS